MDSNLLRREELLNEYAWSGSTKTFKAWLADKKAMQPDFDTAGIDTDGW